MNSDIKTILRNVLEKYDVSKTKLDKKTENYSYYTIKYNQSGMNEIILYDDNKNIIYNSKIQLLGIYMPNIKLWKWGWSLIVNKKDNYISRKILEYALDINEPKVVFIREPLINSNITINSELELDLFIALCLYLSKQTYAKGFYKIPENEAENELFNVKKVMDDPAINDYMIIYYILIED